MGLTKMAAPGSIWTKPGLAEIMQANHAAADEQDAHALEDILAARQRAKARRPSRGQRLRSLVARFSPR